MHNSRHFNPDQYEKRFDKASTAFTLVELLVVIAIIAVLVALLFPTFRRVQDSGKTAACLGNLHQIGVAVFSYAGEHDGALTPPVIQDGTAVDGAVDFETILIDQKYVAGAETTDPTALPKSSVFRCQAGLPNVSSNDRAKFSDPAYASKDDAQGYRPSSNGKPLFFKSGDGTKTYYVHSWYGYNGVVNNDAPIYPFWSPQDSSASSPPWRISGGRRIITLANLPKVVGIYCGMGFHNGAISRIAARHNQRSAVNIMFMDGHGATLPISDVQAAFNETTTPYKNRKFQNLSFSTNFD